MELTRTPRLVRHATAIVLAVSLFGAGGVATAASSSAASSSAASISSVPSASASITGGKSSTASPSGELPAPAKAVERTPADPRGVPKPIIDAAVKLIKSVPGWWSKFVSGVKKAYSWFVANVWKPLVKIINVLGTLIGAWEIWNFFH